MAIVAMIMGASIAGALVTTSLNVKEQVGEEFTAFGANILIVPVRDTIDIGIGGVEYGSMTEMKYINESDLPLIKTIGWAANVLGYAPYLFTAVSVSNPTSNIANQTNITIIISGTWFDEVEKICPWWTVTGEWISDRNDTQSVMIGKEVKKQLGLDIGDIIKVDYKDNDNVTTYPLNIVGILDTGGSEDKQIFVSLKLAQGISGLENSVSTVQVSALCNACPVSEIAKEIQEIGFVPEVEAKAVKSVVEAQMNILGKVEEMMILVAIVALSASALGVMTTMTTSVLERTKEIGIMKAIGAENKKIAALFLLEAAIIGIVGGVVGYFVGLGIAQFIGITTFGSFMAPKLIVFPMVLGISIGITLLASTLPVRRALRIEPAKVLRGE